MRLPLLLKPSTCRHLPRVRRPCAQQRCDFSSSSTTKRRLASLETLPASDLPTFRQLAFRPELPYCIAKGHFLDSLPAVRKWFTQPSSQEESLGPNSGGQDIQAGKLEAIGSNRPTIEMSSLNNEYLSCFDSTVVPMELFLPEVASTHTASGPTPSPSTSSTNPEGTASFQRLEVPLSHFLSLHETQERADPSNPIPHAYIAQAPLASLPQELQADLPTPELVIKAGRGDIYDSSIWLGRAPTYTPLHKDPNPNLFVQLAGRKVIRVFAPEVGRELFQEAAKITGMVEGSEAMMSGKGRRALEDMIWGELMDRDGPRLGHEAALGPGDAVFVPKGWWHSIKGIGEGVVGSVNWWFR